MKKPNFKQGWEAFVRWKGWSATACVLGKDWRKTAGWRGWKKIFCLPVPVLLPLNFACGMGLLFVFAKSLEATAGAYCLYSVSAYGLAALCGKLPGAICRGKQWLEDHPKLKGILANQELQFRLGLYFEQFLNFAYGIFKIASGVVLGSAWIGCDGIYNVAQALIQLFQILRKKFAKTLEQQWRSYRLCGVLILLMHLTLIGIVFQMINWNRAEEQGQIQVIATAVFAFYKVISSFVSIAKDRKHVRPVDSSIRMLNLAQAFFAIFALQASMFHTFGTGVGWEHGMNLLTGCTVCLLVVSIGVYMIRRGTREMETIQEKKHGES